MICIIANARESGTNLLWGDFWPAIVSLG
jgi:hypothetical protein